MAPINDQRQITTDNSHNMRAAKSMDYAAKADLCVGGHTVQTGKLADLIRHVMTNMPSGKRPTCTIMQGQRIYTLAQIEEIFRRPDFPPAGANGEGRI
jgi:hypothetical protein